LLRPLAARAYRPSIPYPSAMSTSTDAAPARRRARSQPKGRQPGDPERARVEALCAGLAPRADLLIEHLHRLQDADGGLRRAMLAALAERLRLAQAEVFEVASFYHHFELLDDDAPAPSVTVRVCTSLSCTLAGAGSLREALQAESGGRWRVVDTPCIGRCHQAPAVCLGQHAWGPADVGSVATCLSRGETSSVVAPTIAFADYRAEGGYRCLAECLNGHRPVESVIDEIAASGLRGLGGAGFPTARKWRAVREQPGPRLLAVNLDEGEVGTFKDHHCLAGDPHRCIEGALLAAWAVDAERVYLYLRDEYHDLRALLQRELAALGALRAEGLALPPIELRRGAGAYICGEESAMIESIEGKRGLPRLRPPYVAQRGLFGRPTLVQNIETLGWVRDIVERGGAWFAGHGRRGRSGLRRFSISGRVRRPGVALAPAGISLNELIEEHAGGLLAGHRLYAWLPGGASGGILPAALADLPLDFDTLAEHGCFVGSMAVIVLTESDTHRDLARDAALNLMRFFEHESCGQCTPCREGTRQAVELLQAPSWDAALLGDLSLVMREASICGLGQAAPNPVDCVLRYFAHEVGR